uniref:Crinkler effector protein N-terminal domain-containing protein n=1 Tax=Phytophthora ramorum TaxID=164328 RepID=H3H6E1_PHYRM
MVKLFCAIAGVAGSAFEVRVDESDSVYDLKKVIKGEKPNDLKDIDADKLQLFLAKKEDGAWLTEADVKKGRREQGYGVWGYRKRMSAEWVKKKKQKGEDL